MDDFKDDELEGAEGMPEADVLGASDDADELDGDDMSFGDSDDEDEEM